MVADQSLTFNGDFQRPRYHFLPAANWMNDPNGVIHWQGRYHLFFQYNPDGAYHANMHWGHAVSDDLVHWQELPIAIAPTPNSPDQGGIFSGCMVNDKGRPVAVYTGVNDDYTMQVQCLAKGNTDLTQWHKHPGNPVLKDVPEHLGQTQDFRDPFVWQGDSCWYMLLAANIVGVGGAVLLYRSSNLIDWDYLNPLYIGDRARNGFNFECPNLFRLGDKWVLIVSSQPEAHVAGATLYWVGRFENERFIPEHEGVYDAGYSYASLVHEDDARRHLVYSWIREGRSVDEQRKAGWSGVQAIPRILYLDGKSRLCSQPVPEFETLRGKHYHFDAHDIDDAPLPVSGLSLDIEAEFDVTAAETCGIKVALAPDGGEHAAIVYESSTQTLQIQRRYSQDNPDIDSYTQGLAHILDLGETLKLRILLDGSVLEVIANGRASIISRMYPSSAENQAVGVIGSAALISLDIWELSSIW